MGFVPMVPALPEGLFRYNETAPNTELVLSTGATPEASIKMESARLVPNNSEIAPFELLHQLTVWSDSVDFSSKGKNDRTGFGYIANGRMGAAREEGFRQFVSQLKSMGETIPPRLEIQTADGRMVEAKIPVHRIHGTVSDRWRRVAQRADLFAKVGMVQPSHACTSAPIHPGWNMARVLQESGVVMVYRPPGI